MYEMIAEIRAYFSSFLIKRFGSFFSELLRISWKSTAHKMVHKYVNKVKLPQIENTNFTFSNTRLWSRTHHQIKSSSSGIEKLSWYFDHQKF